MSQNGRRPTLMRVSRPGEANHRYHLLAVILSLGA